jgi:hypothetical protein
MISYKLPANNNNYRRHNSLHISKPQPGKSAQTNPFKKPVYYSKLRVIYKSPQKPDSNACDDVRHEKNCFVITFKFYFSAKGHRKKNCQRRLYYKRREHKQKRVFHAFNKNFVLCKQIYKVFNANKNFASKYIPFKCTVINCIKYRNNDYTNINNQSR